MADGEAGVRELLLREEREEVRLVFVFIGAFEERKRAVGQGEATGVVAGGDGGEAVVFGPRAQDAKFDLAVAHHVGIGREAVGVAFQQVVHDAFAVIAHEVDDVELDAEVVGDAAGIVDILLPRAVTDDVVLVDPVFHVGAHEIVALLFEEQGGDGAVDAAGEGDEDFFAGGHRCWDKNDAGRRWFVK